MTAAKQGRVKVPPGKEIRAAFEEALKHEPPRRGRHQIGGMSASTLSRWQHGF